MGGLFSGPQTDDERSAKVVSLYRKLRLAHSSVPEVGVEELLRAGAARKLWHLPAAAASTTPVATTAAASTTPSNTSAPSGAGDAGADESKGDAASESVTMAPLLLVDCRAVEERAVSSIPASMHQSEFEDMAKGGRVPDNAVVVCFCTIGYRSGMFAKSMAKQHSSGDKNQHTSVLRKPTSDVLTAPAASITSPQFLNLAGSLLAWTHANGPLVDVQHGNGETKRLHVYSKAWAYQASTYDAVH